MFCAIVLLESPLMFQAKFIKLFDVFGSKSKYTGSFSMVPSILTRLPIPLTEKTCMNVGYLLEYA